MQTYLPRFVTRKIMKKLQAIPAVAVIGPRQCGKTTLAKAVISELEDTVYLDLELSSDLAKLSDPEAFLRYNAGKVICLDEIQRRPELFPILRALIDESNRNGQFIILGSAAPELLKQSSESLAGRISYIELTPFALIEIDDDRGPGVLRNIWTRGGFPRSYLGSNAEESFEWRLDFIRTYLERDIPQLGFNIPARKLERFWRMCAHVQGQLLNSSKLGESLGVSHHTVRTYIEMLEQTFIVRTLLPFTPNLKKRLVKSPKLYIRDTGLLHTLLGIETHNDLLGHPVYGTSWESFVIENIISLLPGWKAFFYRTAAGAEIDLVIEKGNRRIAIECKVSTSPGIGRGFWNAMKDLHINEAWIVAPVTEPYPLKDNVMVTPLRNFLDKMI